MLDWRSYKALCDQPDYWTRWMLEQCLDLLDQLEAQGEHVEDLIGTIRRALLSKPLLVPDDHAGLSATHMFQLSMPASQREQCLNAVHLAELRGLRTPATKTRGLGGFIAAWQEYTSYTSINER